MMNALNVVKEDTGLMSAESLVEEEVEEIETETSEEEEEEIAVKEVDMIWTKVTEESKV